MRGLWITVVYAFIAIITNFTQFNGILTGQSDTAYSEGWSSILFVWINAKISEVSTKNLFSSLLKSLQKLSWSIFTLAGSFVRVI